MLEKHLKRAGPMIVAQGICGSCYATCHRYVVAIVELSSLKALR